MITAEAADAINGARRVVAVGTTSLRLIESAADEDGRVQAFRRGHVVVHHAGVSGFAGLGRW